MELANHLKQLAVFLLQLLVIEIYCRTEQMKFGINVVHVDDFRQIKVETLYQCVEICYQFSVCKACSFGKGTCFLHDKSVAELLQVINCINCGKGIVDKSEFPNHISGACMDHTCGEDKRCMPFAGNSRKICVPHGLPIFTCPRNWIRHSKSCFRITLKNSTWHSAYTHCRAEGANLIEIHDEDTSEYISRSLSFFSQPNHTSKAVHKPGGQLYWTGLTDHTTDGQWVWRGSGKAQKGYSYWIVNATLEMSVPGNDCVGLSTIDNFQWKPVKCDSLYFFVCEKIMVK